jgi:cytochrome c-type biogenesis protein CcmF
VIENIGYFSLVLTFLISIYGVGAAAYGATHKRPDWVESARHAMLLTWPLLTLSSLALVALLVMGRYDIGYVASVTSNSMPVYLKITALWGGQSGSLVFWSWLMAAFATAASMRKWDRDREFLPWVIVVTMVTLAFFLSLVILYENPFARLWQTLDGNRIQAMFQPEGALPQIPIDGQGLNPLLKHPGMIIHPPMLYLGFVSFVIPYAFAIAALITGRTDTRWIRITRRWSLIAWLFLSLGLVLGSWWAYDVLGWGGYWGWDPVEISALMPWLTGTAFLHSVIIQEKRGMMKQWNMILIILTYALVILGTFLTRTGVLTSVHAFAESEIGPLFLLFIGITFVVSVSLLIQRWGDLRGENHLDSVFSREALFLLNNLLFIGFLVVCFWGFLFPVLSEFVTGQQVTVGPPYYERSVGPLAGGLLLLMAVAPLSVYGRTSWKRLGWSIWKPAILSLIVVAILFITGTTSVVALIGYGLVVLVALVTLYEFWRGAVARHQRHGESLPLSVWRLIGRYRRRYGGYIVHIGVIMMALGILGIELFQTETQGTLARGEQITLGKYTIIYDSLAIWDTDDGRNVTRAVVDVYREGQPVGQLYPRRDFYYDSQQSVTVPGVRSTLEGDFYLVLAGWESIGEQGATFKIYHNPLVNFIWIGSVVFTLGAMVAAWPSRESEQVRRKVPARGAIVRA